MELSINVLSWLGRPKKAVSAQTIKFNRFNLIFNSRCKLKPGQLVYVNITQDIHSIREVSARVESCERCGPHYQTQVRFVLERPDKQPYREAITILKAIEQNLPASLRAPLHMQPLTS
ncbi:MAG: hypothetical protein HWE18_02550 [Gammaproteobacteria bacterium]|nr:hypothetical protein [Gammaproteobacteria bacterium]